MLTSINLNIFKYSSLRNTNKDIIAIAVKCFNKIKFHFMLKLQVKKGLSVFSLAP